MINLGPAFENQIAQELGLGNFDPNSLDIALINPDGPTTVRFTIPYSIDTATLQGFIRATLPAE